MSVIKKIEDGLALKDWSLIQDALGDLTGIRSSYSIPFTKEEVSTYKSVPTILDLPDAEKFMINASSIHSKFSENVVNKNVFVNKFVDDMTLDAEFIEVQKNVSPKKYRPENTNTGFQTVTCGRCSSKMEVANEEFAFKNRDDESSGFVCSPCMKRAIRK